MISCLSARKHLFAWRMSTTGPHDLSEWISVRGWRDFRGWVQELVRARAPPAMSHPSPNSPGRVRVFNRSIFSVDICQGVIVQAYSRPALNIRCLQFWVIFYLPIKNCAGQVWWFGLGYFLGLSTCNSYRVLEYFQHAQPILRRYSFDTRIIFQWYRLNREVHFTSQVSNDNSRKINS